MIRMLQDLTGIDPLEIPLDSKEVMSLFQNTSALGIKPEDIGGTKLGALGIPEFGTDFAMQDLRMVLMYGLAMHRLLLKKEKLLFQQLYVHETIL